MPAYYCLFLRYFSYFLSLIFCICFLVKSPNLYLPSFLSTYVSLISYMIPNLTLLASWIVLPTLEWCCKEVGFEETLCWISSMLARFLEKISSAFFSSFSAFFYSFFSCFRIFFSCLFSFIWIYFPSIFLTAFLVLSPKWYSFGTWDSRSSISSSRGFNCSLNCSLEISSFWYYSISKSLFLTNSLNYSYC